MAWVPAALTGISLERLGETAPFDLAAWIDAPLAKLDGTERAEIFRRVSLCLGPSGRALITYDQAPDYTPQNFSEDFRAAGLVQDAIFRSWELHPQTVDATSSIVALLPLTRNAPAGTEPPCRPDRTDPTGPAICGERPIRQRAPVSAGGADSAGRALACRGAACRTCRRWSCR